MTGDEQARWVRRIARGLKDAGVARAVISPGSRSGPLALALSEALPSEVIVDERGAAFFALGQVATTGAPTVLCCTSGSAAAHYLPAVIEASQVGLPLVLLTADRPWELRHVGASQTVDQRNIFGAFARASIELGVADEAARRHLPFLIARAVFLSLGPLPGPVHLNVELRKPLEPESPWETAQDPVTQAPRISIGDSTPPRTTVARLGALLNESARAAIVLGPSDALPSAERVRLVSAVRRLAAKADLAVIAESTSGARFTKEPCSIPGVELALRAPGLRAAFAPDLVVEVGFPPISRDYPAWIAGAPQRIVLANSVARDPFGGATEIVLGDAASMLDALSSTITTASSPRRSFSSLVSRLSSMALDAIAGLLLAEPWSEVLAIRAVVEMLAVDSTLVLGNSLPVRDIDLFAPPRAVEVSVVHQRGAAGIDGLIAKAAGVRAATRPSQPVVLVLGDVSALHDVGSLALLAEVEAPLVVLVMNNGGGRIFEELPVAKRAVLAARIELLFLTPPPHGFLESAARAFGVAHEGVDDLPSLREAFAFATRRPKATVVEARFGPASQALRLRIDETLRTLRP